MDNKLVTIVVPIYNVEQYIDKCVKTLREQTYKELEIILVDDGSTDNSGIIADKYAEQDKRIKVIHKKNGGLSDARNSGMKMAKGSYICFIDGDDYVEKDMIEEAIKSITADNLDIAIWGFYTEHEDKNGNFIYNEKITLPEMAISIEKNINQLDINLNLLKVLGYAWNKLYNLDFLKKNNFTFEKGLSGMEDTEFNSRVFQKVSNFKIMDTAFNHYMQRDRETLGNKKYKNLLELNLRFCNCHKSLLEVWKIKDEKIQEIYLLDHFLISKGQIKNIVLDNDMGKKEKKEKIDELLNIPNIQKAFNNKNIQNKKERIYSFLVKKHCISLLKLYYNHM